MHFSLQSFDPVILFFLLGAIATAARSNLRVPDAMYHTLSIYLLLAIGIKGGIELYHNSLGQLLLPALGTVVLGITLTLLAFGVLLKFGRFEREDAIAIAMHYGSVSMVTYAVVTSFLQNQHIVFEKYCAVLLVLFEIPALLVGITLANAGRMRRKLPFTTVCREVFLGKSVLLLLGGLVIGFLTGFTNNVPMQFFFVDLFKGFLALFMLEMGVLTIQQLSAFRKVGPFLVVFGIGMPVIGALLGIGMAIATGMSVGGAIVLATMAASASYIAAPAVARMTLPNANVTWYLTASLGITFPFNVVVGIPIYQYLATYLYQAV
jgi:hypothetical protein